MRAILTAAMLSLAAAIISGPATAHHGWSSYETKPVKVTGPILSTKYENPHGQIEMDYEGKRWTVVLAPVSRMKARGLSESDLTAGNTVTVEAYTLKSGGAEMRAERVTVDGKTVELR